MKSKPSFTKCTQIIAGVLVLLCGTLCGCQPTPVKEAVVNKQRDYLLGNGQAGNNFEGIPEHISDSKNVNGLRLDFEADVKTPNLEKYSVVEVERNNMTDDDFFNLANYFAPSAELYEEVVLNKQQVMERILTLQRVAENEGEGIQAVLSGYQDKLKTAPEDARPLLKPFDIQGVPDGRRFRVFSINDEHNTFSSFLGTRNGNQFLYKRDYAATIMREEYFDDTDIEHLKDFEGAFPISFEEGLQIAEQVVQELKLDNLAFSYGDKACVYYDDFVLGEKGWEFIFTRENNGLPSYYVDGGQIWNSQMPELTAPWGQECLFIFVDEEGLYRFDWRGAAKQTAVLTEDVALLPFNEILARAEQQLMYQHIPLLENENTDASIYIYEIRLASVLVNVPGRPEAGRDIPAWDFLYELRIKDGATEVHETYITCINAIDGSYIEPRVTLGNS